MPKANIEFQIRGTVTVHYREDELSDLTKMSDYVLADRFHDDIRKFMEQTGGDMEATDFSPLEEGTDSGPT